MKRLKSRIKKALIGILVSIGSIFGVADSVNAVSGRLDVLNHLDLPHSNQSCKLIQIPEGLEGVDSYDNLYGPFFDTQICSKIISKIENLDYMINVKHEESTSPFNLETSIIARGVQKGNLIYIDSLNWLGLDMAKAESLSWDFGNKTISVQQYDKIPDLNNPKTYSVYDARKEIAFGQDNFGWGRKLGIIHLPDLNGYYGSEIPYAFFKVEFDRNLADFNNDKKVDMLDLAILGAQFGRTGNSLADIGISDPNNAIYLSPNTTFYFDGVVDLADLVKFSENWGYGWGEGIQVPAPVFGKELYGTKD